MGGANKWIGVQTHILFNMGVQERLRHKNVFCTSLRWIKWAKKYMARAQRRKLKQEVSKNDRYSF